MRPDDEMYGTSSLPRLQQALERLQGIETPPSEEVVRQATTKLRHEIVPIARELASVSEGAARLEEKIATLLENVARIWESGSDHKVSTKEI